MAKIEVTDWDKNKTGELELNPAVFEVPVRKDILHTMVRWQLACRRRGTHKTKTKAMVSGGGIKPYKQKGTGNARQGSSRSPLLEGGGVIFGPKPRDYSYSLPKKFKQLGLRNAVSHLHKEGRLFVVKDMTSAEGKTKELFGRLNGFGIKKAVLLDGEENTMFKRASKNIPNICYYSANGLNVYDLLKFDTAVVTEQGIKQIEQRCGFGS